MNKLILIPLLLLAVTAQASPAADASLDSYRKQGAGTFDATAGKQLWNRPNPTQEAGSMRSCTDCHGSNLSLPGKHLRTGKRIEPMNPSVTPSRLANEKKIEKWFKRNCKWTFGRECSPQEKGDLILFIQQKNN